MCWSSSCLTFTGSTLPFTATLNRSPEQYDIRMSGFSLVVSSIWSPCLHSCSRRIPPSFWPWRILQIVWWNRCWSFTQNVFDFNSYVTAGLTRLLFRSCFFAAFRLRCLLWRLRRLARCLSLIDFSMWMKADTLLHWRRAQQVQTSAHRRNTSFMTCRTISVVIRGRRSSVIFRRMRTRKTNRTVTNITNWYDHVTSSGWGEDAITQDSSTFWPSISLNTSRRSPNSQDNQPTLP